MSSPKRAVKGKQHKRPITYWRMQLHPDDAAESAHHANMSIAAGFIGLDFRVDVGDLLLADKEDLPETQRDYWAFAHEIRTEDQVLIIAHHFPLALVTVAGEYNYIRRPEPKIGVWFRHFRRVADVRYYADRKTNARAWKQLRMTDTISPLRDVGSASYRLINTWA